MTMTSLNIGHVAPDRPRIVRTDGKCPQCGAAKETRMDGGSFGSAAKRILCGMCGYEFKEQG